ncbi:N-terminal double-transmembrane domain-containing protein [Candidatus Kryptobacter tengchongensis]|nr:N-terminal double-transmembrane domain-containing protein [Candidatus Kryptobacter tengchongensis]
MTFLNPTFLFALFASAIPVLIHLFNLRRLKTVEFSSIKFLKELQRSRIRSLKIKQIILLLIRVLAIVFLVLAFSRPVIKGYLFKPMIAGHARSSVVIILDNTLSMASTDEKGRFINQAKSIAQSIMDILTESDEFALIRLSDIPNIATDGFTHNISFMRKLIDETEFTYTHKKLYDALAVSSKIIEKSKNLNREIYIISDMQKSEFDFPSDTVNRKFKLPPDVRVFTINVGEFKEQNFSVDKVEIKNKVIFPGRTLSLEAIVSNHGKVNMSNYVVSVFLNGRRVAQKSINLKYDASQTVDFNILTEELSGFVDGFVEIEDDNFNFDNRRYFSFFIPGEIRILLAGDEGDIKFLKLALSTVHEIYKRSFFKINQVSLQTLSSVDFSNFDVVFLVKPIQIDRATSGRLKNFVSNGGALVLFMGSNANLQALNQNFNSIFNIPEFEGIARQKMLFSKIDITHPIFEGVFTEKPKKFDSPEIREYVKFKTNYGFTSIIELADGSPFLIEKNEGSGKILIFTTEPTDKASDLPYKGIFIPLIFQSILYITTPSGLKTEYSIGDTAEVRIDFMRKFYGQILKDLKLLRPDGSDFAFELSGGNFLKINQATIPGIYAISGGNRNAVLKLAFNPPYEEFKYKKVNEEEIISFLNRVGIKQYKMVEHSDGIKVREEILRARYGVELWKVFLVLSIFMFLAESLISRKM